MTMMWWSWGKSLWLGDQQICKGHEGRWGVLLLLLVQRLLALGRVGLLLGSCGSATDSGLLLL